MKDPQMTQIYADIPEDRTASSRKNLRSSADEKYVGLANND